MAHLFAIAKHWETDDITDDDRAALKSVITRLVCYPCKIACRYDAELGLVDIHVFSEEAKRIVDWLDLQDNGAFDILEEMYVDHRVRLNKSLRERCEAYNWSIGVTYTLDDSEEDDTEDNDTEDDTEDDSSTSASDSS